MIALGTMPAAECATGESDIEDADGAECSGLRRYPDDLPLPKRLEDVPPGFFLSVHQVDLMMTVDDPEPWRLSGCQEGSLRDLRLRTAAADEARHKAAIEARRAAKAARKAALWRRDYELQQLKRARPDWYKPGLNAHNLELRRQKMELVKRVAGYLAELCGPGGYAAMKGHYPDALRAVYGTPCPYQSPRKARELRTEVWALCSDYIAARTAAREDAEKAASVAPFEGATPPTPHVRLPKRHRGKSIQRTVATRLTESRGYSTRRAPAKPEISEEAVSAWVPPQTLPLPTAPGTSTGPRNIPWLPAKALPHKMVGLAAANLPRLESPHGRHGCTVAWDRRHALNYLASGLAAGRPLSGLIAAYRDALGREDFGSWVPGRVKRSPGRVIARARRAAYRLGIVSQWALDAYRERRNEKSANRLRCRDFEAHVKAQARAENDRFVAAAKAAVNSDDLDERGRARRFLDGLGISY